MRDELKLKSQLEQLREQYVRETAPKSAKGQQRGDLPRTPRKEQIKTPDNASMRSVAREQA